MLVAVIVFVQDNTAYICGHEYKQEFIKREKLTQIGEGVMPLCLIICAEKVILVSIPHFPCLLKLERKCQRHLNTGFWMSVSTQGVKKHTGFFFPLSVT